MQMFGAGGSSGDTEGPTLASIEKAALVRELGGKCAQTGKMSWSGPWSRGGSDRDFRVFVGI